MRLRILTSQWLNSSEVDSKVYKHDINHNFYLIVHGGLQASGIKLADIDALLRFPASSWTHWGHPATGTQVDSHGPVDFVACTPVATVQEILRSCVVVMRRGIAVLSLAFAMPFVDEHAGVVCLTISEWACDLADLESALYHHCQH